MSRDDQSHRAERYDLVLRSKRELDEFATAALTDLLEEAAEQTKRFLRGTRRWVNDVGHEKLALRWGYELVERFLVQAEGEIPCRPFLLLDSITAKFFSQPEPFYYHDDLLTPLGRFLDGLVSRAVVSRDALAALFYHLYGVGQGHVAALLGLNASESQRIYKNFERWRASGWHRMVAEIGMTSEDLAQIEQGKRRDPAQLSEDTGRILKHLLAHYRKSEPQHYPCLTRHDWSALCEQNYGYDYRAWHLALCQDCLADVCDLLAIPSGERGAKERPYLDLQVHPLPKGGPLTLFFGSKGASNGLPALAGHRKRGATSNGPLSRLN